MHALEPKPHFFMLNKKTENGMERHEWMGRECLKYKEQHWIFLTLFLLSISHLYENDSLDFVGTPYFHRLIPKNKFLIFFSLLFLLFSPCTILLWFIYISGSLSPLYYLYDYFYFYFHRLNCKSSKCIVFLNIFYIIFQTFHGHANTEWCLTIFNVQRMLFWSMKIY